MPDTPPRPARPADAGLGQLRPMIHAVANGSLPVDELIQNFRRLHEAIERQGRPQYHSKRPFVF